MPDERDRRGPRSWSSWNPVYTLVLSLVVAGAYAWIVTSFLRSLHGAYSVESTRLLIVLTLIIAMLGFGGLLIARALFSPDPGAELQNRFRLAREIFLVFSGIFGTIIGFYFGASDENAGASPAIEIAYANKQVTATVTGGAAPFIGIITISKDAAGALMTADNRLLTYKVENCPKDATILIVDGRGRRAEATVKCETGTSSDGGGAETPADSNGTDQDTSAGDNVTNND